MTIQSINDVAQFSTNSGVVNSSEAFHEIAPAFKYAGGTFIYNDIGKFNNEAFKFYIRMDDVNSTTFKIMLGCDSNGAGQAIQFDFSSTNKWVRFVNTSGWDVLYDSVVVEKEISNLFRTPNSYFIECKVIVSNNKIRFYYNGMLLIDSTLFSPTSTYWGFCNRSGSSQVWTSDMFYVYDQILYGNVNLNGAADGRGIVVVYNQATYEVVSYTHCDDNGEYMVFLDDDPANVNKYFLYGFIPGVGTVQPRGVSNITL